VEQKLVADPDIQLGRGQFIMFPSISGLLLR